MRPLPIDAIAGMPSFVLGVAIIRGAATPVVDAGALLGIPTAAPTRFVSVKADEHHRVALAVDAVRGIHVLAGETLAQMPALLSRTRPELIEAIGTLDSRLLLLLRSTHILPADVAAALR